MGNFLSAVTNIFTANTKAKSAEVNANFQQVVGLFNNTNYDAKHGTVFLTVTDKSADYTILDNDGYHTFLMTTGASNRTITLPTALDNAGRIIKFKKIDSGAGALIIDGEGAETIEDAPTVTLSNRYDAIQVTCNGVEWFITSREIAGQVVGTGTSSAASAGNVGELAYGGGANTATTDVINLTTPAYKSIVSMNLGPGDWDISLSMHLEGKAGAAVTVFEAAVSQVTDSISGTTQGRNYILMTTPTIGSGGHAQLSIPRVPVSLAATTTFYGVAKGTGGSGTVTEVNAYMAARRVR